MKTATGLIGKVGFTAIGLGMGLILAAGSGAAAVNLSRNLGNSHAIDVVQASSSHVGSAAVRLSSVKGADDRVPEPTEAREPAEQEPADDKTSATASTDDRTSKTASTDDSRKLAIHVAAAPKSPKPGDDPRLDG